MAANDRQVGGAHYAAKMQHWDLCVRAFGNRYLEGNVTKYLSRWRRKNGMQDLEKALHYMEKLHEEAYAGRVQPHAADLYTRGLSSAEVGARLHAASKLASDFCVQCDMTTTEQQILIAMATWLDARTLFAALSILRGFVAERRDKEAFLERLGGV